MRFLETTLLHPCQTGPANDYSNLSRALTVRCATWDASNANYVPLPMGTFLPAVRISNAELKSMKTMGNSEFKYRGKGNLEDSPLRHFRNDENNHILDELIPSGEVAPIDSELAQQVRIEGWAQQIPPATLSDSVEDTAGRSLYTDSSECSSSYGGKLSKLDIYHCYHIHAATIMLTHCRHSRATAMWKYF